MQSKAQVPFLRRFAADWATAEIVRIQLKNRRAYAKRVNLPEDVDNHGEVSVNDHRGCLRMMMVKRPQMATVKKIWRDERGLYESCFGHCVTHACALYAFPITYEYALYANPYIR